MSARPAATPDAVRSCYATWSDTYYDKYYGAGAGYPPVHRDLVRRLLVEAGSRSVLDAGCGPASMLRELAGGSMDVYGFDLTPEMVAEAQRVLASLGIPGDRAWAGSVLDPASFTAPDGRRVFDAAICIGVLPHIEAASEGAMLENLRAAVRPGGLVVLEARNQLFSLFTLNRYTHEFFLQELIGARAKQSSEALAALRAMFRTDLPPRRRGTADEPGYDEVLARGHNPLLLPRQLERAGFRDVRVLFYHYHCLPPMLAELVPDLFAAESLAMEDPGDWRGHFMASAFLVAGIRE